MPKINETLLAEIEKTIEMEYPIKPEWTDARNDIRDRNIAVEYNRLTKLRGYSRERAKLILAHLIGRGIKVVEKAIYPN